MALVDIVIVLLKPPYQENLATTTARNAALTESASHCS